MLKPPEAPRHHDSSKSSIVHPSEPFSFHHFTMRHPVEEFKTSDNVRNIKQPFASYHNYHQGNRKYLKIIKLMILQV